MNSKKQFPNTPILITGCQRSGTTLLWLILDSHPDVVGVDETAFSNQHLRDYLTQDQYGPNVCLKLPELAAHYKTYYVLGEPKIIWCRRDPKAVVASMIHLKMGYDENNNRDLLWTETFATSNVSRCYETIEKNKSKVEPFMAEFHDIIQRKQPHEFNRQDNVFIGSLCWRIKDELFADVAALGYPSLLLQYENLVNQPQETIEAIIDFCGLTWHDNLLRHDKTHRGVMIGNTDTQRSIDTNSLNKWQSQLSDDDLRIIQRVCESN